MRNLRLAIGLLLPMLIAGGNTWALAPTKQTLDAIPPRPPREFRGAWIATVANLDWPTKPGLSSQQQQAELLAILDRATQLKLNVLILQVRPACDAFFESKYEPWSEFLTGRMGKPPEPYYDPLAFAVEQAHRRGLELHAWFNPFRVRGPSFKGGVSTNHIGQTHPQWVRHYGSQIWLDPGVKAVREYAINIILDVVNRYDVDAVHLDDYFYPYPEKDRNGQWLEFPDEASWKSYSNAGGILSRADWRRKNIDDFVEGLYGKIKEAKRWVKLGISPFGIWRPGFPKQIKGLDAYEFLYADSRKWLANGWVDYLAPQLYWEIQEADHSYPALLEWWAGQNQKSRHLWPGNDLTKVGGTWSSTEISKQIRLSRKLSGVTGNTLWNMTSLMHNNGHIADAFARDLYKLPALVPASPWLQKNVPGKPRLVLAPEGSSKEWKVSWHNPGTQDVWLWYYQARNKGKWSSSIFPGDQTFASLPNHQSASFPDLIAVTAIGRCGETGATSLIETKKAVNLLSGMNN